MSSLYVYVCYVYRFKVVCHLYIERLKRNKEGMVINEKSKESLFCFGLLILSFRRKCVREASVRKNSLSRGFGRCRNTKLTVCCCSNFVIRPHKNDLCCFL